MFESSSTMTRSFSEGQGVHWFSFDALVDRRYVATVQLTKLYSGMVKVDGQFSGDLYAGPVAIAELVVEPLFTGPYLLLLQGHYHSDLEFSYRILVRELTDVSSSEPDVGASQANLSLGVEYSGRIDVDTDRDGFQLDAPAGGRYMVTLTGTGDHPLTTGYFGDIYNQHLRIQASQWALPTGGGRGFEVGSTGGIGDYKLIVTERAPDDHPDTGLDAKLLEPNGALPGVIEIPGDVDAFRIIDRPGQRVEVSLVTASPADGSGITLYVSTMDGQLGVSLDGDAGSNTYVLPGAGWGPVTLDVTGPLTNAAYTIQTRVLPPDDHSDTATGATPLPLAQVVVGRLDGRPDVDTFSLELEAGRRYRIEVDTDIVDSTRSLLRATLQGHLDRLPGDLPAQRSWNAGGGDVIVQAVVADSGQYTLRLEGPPSAYTLRLSELEPDDHADSNLGATPARVGWTTSGQLSGGFDVDTFVFDAAAGQKYQVSLTTPDPSGSYDRSMHWSGAGGTGGYALGGYGASPQTMIVNVERSGPIFVRIEGRESDTWLYWLRIDAMAPVEPAAPQPDRPPPQTYANATRLTVAEARAPTFVDGGAGDDRLFGTDGDDVIRGAGGNDWFVFGPGFDKISGGEGVDVLAVPGSERDYDWHFDRSAHVWWLAGRVTLDTARLEGVERVEFDDRGMLLEAGAGSSGAVLRLLQSVLGARGHYAYLDAALALQDEGRDLASVAHWALERLTLETTTATQSNDSLVRWVSGNVPGLLASEAEIKDWVARLDRGEVTPEQALVAGVMQAPADLFLVGLQFPIWYSVEQAG